MEIKLTSESRFGVVAVKNGFITPEQLMDAFTTQVKEELKGNKRRHIGKILYEKGHITMHQITEVLDFMKML
jgi:starvation-inducible outer membrane lipoprotein